MAHRSVVTLLVPLLLAAGLLAVTAPAEAATYQQVWTMAPATVTRGAESTIVVTARPIRKGREVRIRIRHVGGDWVYLGKARERASGNAVVPFRIEHSGSYELQATVVGYGSLPRIRGRVKQLKVVPSHVPVVIAHRGGASSAPENTMAAFELAVHNGADRLETDVQETSDGTLVLFHDRSLARTTDVASKFPGRENDPLTTFTFAELETLDAGSSFSPTRAGERIPTFAALLDLARAKGVAVLAEAKLPDSSPGIEQRMLDTVHAAGLASTRQDDRVVFESFDLGSLRRFLELDPDANVSPILTSFPADLTTIAWAGSITLAAPATTTARVAAAHARGLEVNVWTPNTADKLALFADTGADGLITDNTAVAAGVLR